jgi:hypothetical protein
MEVRKEYLAALIAAAALYIIITAYNISTLEYRVGKMEHRLAHLDIPECAH